MMSRFPQRMSFAQPATLSIGDNAFENNLTLLPRSEKTCNLQAVEAVRGQKRPHYAVVRLI